MSSYLSYQPFLFLVPVTFLLLVHLLYKHPFLSPPFVFYLVFHPFYFPLCFFHLRFSFEFSCYPVVLVLSVAQLVLLLHALILSVLATMDTHIEAKEYGWTDSSDSDINDDLLEEELGSDLLSSNEDEIPFARHGPIVVPDLEEVSIQRDFWSSCAIGFILDYRKFSVNHL